MIGQKLEMISLANQIRSHKVNKNADPTIARQRSSKWPLMAGTGLAVLEEKSLSLGNRSKDNPFVNF